MGNFFDDLFTTASKLHERKKRYILRAMDADGLFETTEETSINGAEGPKTEETVTIHQAGCGHFVGLYNPHELIATCSQCGITLCRLCGNLRCHRCRTLLCPKCAKGVGEEVYCSTCRVMHYTKRLSIVSLKGLHQLLLKEIQ